MDLNLLLKIVRDSKRSQNPRSPEITGYTVEALRFTMPNNKPESSAPLAMARA
jgi:hypothetical protein